MIYAFLSSFLFGVGDVFTKLGSVRLGEVNMTLYNAVLSFPVALIVFAFWHSHIPPLNHIVIMALIQVLSCVAFLFFFAALTTGPVSVVGSIVAGYSVIPFIGGMVFLHERLSLLEIFSIIIIIFGSVLISYDKNEGRASYRRRWVIFTFIAMFLWGIWAFLTKYYNDFIDPYLMPVVFGLIAPFVWLPFLLKNIEKIEMRGDKISFLFVSLSLVLTTLGGILFYLSLKEVPVSIATPIVGIYPVFTVIISRVFMNEVFAKHQYIAFALIITGIIFISV